MTLIQAQEALADQDRLIIVIMREQDRRAGLADIHEEIRRNHQLEEARLEKERLLALIETF